MNIALVILHADPARGGAERYTIDLAAALAGRGHGVRLVARSFAAVPDAVGKVPLDVSSVTRLGQYRRFLDALDAHLAAAAGKDYDVVHAMLPVRRCDVYHPHAGIAAESLACGHLKYEGPVMQVIAQTANRMNRKRQRFAAVERELLARPDGPPPPPPPVVLCLSDYVRREVRKHYPSLPDDRLATLFNGTDLRRFDPAARPDAGREVRARLGIGPDKVVALMIAQDYQRKGLAEAILALAALKDDPRPVLLVVGKQDPAAYRKLAQRQGVAGRVVFAGPTTDPYAFYRAADFFVLPTRHDPCSLVVLEALAMGVPVVSTVFNGACEVMTPQRHGFVLADPADVNSLAGAMRVMLDDARRREMSEACLALRPRLSYEHHLDELIRIYETSVGR